ncbi:SH3 domain-containing protein [Neptuniibacter sp. PT8_73]|uniref:SH3 domain-containing protein n=1 Tax=unclassified Neptuniibacter TaxID=2630693 RepID=UPI0039F67F0E
MRLFRSWFCLCVLLFALPVQALEYYQVTGDNINIRKGPGQKWRVVAQVNKDQLVLETRREGPWSEVFFLKPNKQKVIGWVFNQYLALQTLEQPKSAEASPFSLEVIADKPVCADRTSVGMGSLCYLDISFVITDSTKRRKQARVECWADFVIPGDRKVIPIKTSDVQSFHLLGGHAEGLMRLNVGLNTVVNPEEFSVAYYNCAAQ